MQMRGCRNQNIWGDNKVAGAASCQRPPSHCRTVGEHRRGQPQQPRAPPVLGALPVCGSCTHPGASQGSCVSAPPHPSNGITLQPGQDPLAHARCRGEAHPGII